MIPQRERVHRKSSPTALIVACGLLGAFAAMVPLGALVYAAIRIANDSGPSGGAQVFEVATHAFSIGAYLTGACSIGLIIAALRGASRTSAPPALDQTDLGPGIVARGSARRLDGPVAHADRMWGEVAKDGNTPASSLRTRQEIGRVQGIQQSHTLRKGEDSDRGEDG